MDDGHEAKAFLIKAAAHHEAFHKALEGGEGDRGGVGSDLHYGDLDGPKALGTLDLEKMFEL